VRLPAPAPLQGPSGGSCRGVGAGGHSLGERHTPIPCRKGFRLIFRSRKGGPNVTPPPSPRSSRWAGWGSEGVGAIPPLWGLVWPGGVAAGAAGVQGAFNWWQHQGNPRDAVREPGKRSLFLLTDLLSAIPRKGGGGGYGRGCRAQRSSLSLSGRAEGACLGVGGVKPSGPWVGPFCPLV
jgi:hypothetical protein